MRSGEVLLVGKRAFSQQKGRVLLRYEPADRKVHALDYPTTPKEWQNAPCYEGPVPDSGWTHSFGYSRSFCTLEKPLLVEQHPEGPTRRQCQRWALGDGLTSVKASAGTTEIATASWRDAVAMAAGQTSWSSGQFGLAGRPTST
jgi:hypothetical protein